MFAVPAAILAGTLAGGLAAPAQASPAEQASAGHLSVTINAMNPSYAAPGATVRLSGTVTNGTRQTQAGLDVRLFTSASHFITRDRMDAYVSRGVASDLIPAGNPFFVSASLRPGTTASWTASFQAGTQGITSFGVYGVTAQLQDLAGNVISADQTLLPFWPGSRAAGLASPLKISWLWPLIGQPQQKVCTATLATNDLAGDLGQGGRLSALLDAGASHPGAQLTWVIDPALLSDVSTMTRRYQVGGQATCTGAAPQPASTAAANWLAALRKVTPGQPTVLTPYANVDMAALVHQGLTRNLATAYRTGEAVAGSVLPGTFGHDVAWPPGGTADLSLLTNLAATEHVGTVVLNSSQMPPVNADTVFRPDDAVASLRVAGLPMNVLLSDNTLTGVLRAGNTSSGTLPKSTEFAVRQRFLAETAMIAAEAPDSRRTIVVAPPGGWSPSEALASDLLGETATAPWLTPTPLTSLSSAADTERAVPRHSPPGQQGEPGRAQPRLPERGARRRRPGSACTSPCSTGPRPRTRAPWTRRCSPRSRRPGAAAGNRSGAALTRGLSDYVTSAEQQGQDHQLGPGTDGRRLRAGPGDDRERTAPGHPGPGGGHRGQYARPDLPADHRPLPGCRDDPAAVAVVSGAAAGQLGPAGVHPDQPEPHQRERNRRSRSPRPRSPSCPPGTAGRSCSSSAPRSASSCSPRCTAPSGGGCATTRISSARKPDPPGSVVTGTSDARHPTEAPDDLADARRWVDDA